MKKLGNAKLFVSKKTNKIDLDEILNNSIKLPSCKLCHRQLFVSPKTGTCPNCKIFKNRILK